MEEEQITGRQHPAGHLGQLLRGDVVLHFPIQLEVLELCSSVEQEISTFPEDQSKLLVVVSHHLGLEHLLGEGHDEAMDVLHSLIGLLPELHVDSSIQLDQPGVQVHLLGLRIVEVDGVSSWVLLLYDQVKMVPQLVTKLPKLSLPLVLEGLLGDVVVEPLHPGVGPQ